MKQALWDAKSNGEDGPADADEDGEGKEEEAEEDDPEVDTALPETAEIFGSPFQDETIENENEDENNDED